MRQFGRNFKAIAEIIGNKTENHVRSFFVTYRKRYNLDAIFKEWEEEHGPFDVKDEKVCSISLQITQYSFFFKKVDFWFCVSESLSLGVRAALWMKIREWEVKKISFFHDRVKTRTIKTHLLRLVRTLLVQVREERLPKAIIEFLCEVCSSHPLTLPRSSRCSLVLWSKRALRPAVCWFGHREIGRMEFV